MPTESSPPPVEAQFAVPAPAPDVAAQIESTLSDMLAIFKGLIKAPNFKLVMYAICIAGMGLTYGFILIGRWAAAATIRLATTKRIAQNEAPDPTVAGR